MAGVKDYDRTNTSNTTIASVSLQEGQTRYKDLNNIDRQIMADIKADVPMRFDDASSLRGNTFTSGTIPHTAIVNQLGSYYYDSDDSTTSDDGVSVIVTTSGDRFKKFTGGVDNVITPEDFGAVGDGTTDDATAITNWLAAAVSSQQVATAIKNTYLVGSSIDVAYTDDLTIELLAGATIKGASGLATPILDLDGTDRTKSFVLRGDGKFDNSLMDFSSGTNSGTCLVVRRWGNVNINGMQFLSTSVYTDEKGDTGLGVSDCYDWKVTNCYFRGQPDQGVYVTGGGTFPNVTTDDGERGVIAHCTFKSCRGGVAIRRESRQVIIESCHFEGGEIGIQTSEATSAGNVLQPPKEVQINNCWIKNMEEGAIEIRRSSYSVISNCRIEDFDGAAGSLPAINLKGTTRTLVSNCIATQQVHSQGTSRGVSLSDTTIDGSSYSSTNNVITNCIFHNVDKGIDDNGAGSTNRAFGNTYNTVNTRIEGNIRANEIHTDNAGNTSFGNTDPVTGYRISTNGDVRFLRAGSTVQYLDINGEAGGNHIKSYSDPAAAKRLVYDSRTNVAGDDASAGALGHRFEVNEIPHLEIKTDGAVTINNHAEQTTWEASGEYRVPPKDLITLNVNSIPTSTATSIGAPALSGWKTGVYQLTAIRKASNNIFHTSKAIIGPNASQYTFNLGTVENSVTATFSNNAGDLEFTQSGGSTNWQFNIEFLTPLFS